MMYIYDVCMLFYFILFAIDNEKIYTSSLKAVMIKIKRCYFRVSPRGVRKNGSKTKLKYEE